ncbi:MAG: hypothetical protein VB071_03165 [Lawsonibacter sp.]|nr:hypothetical protein [Lawsonibacter sp.]
MEAILSLLFLANGMLILYQIIRVAVREGVSEALKQRNQTGSSLK